MLMQIGTGNMLSTEVISVEVCWDDNYYNVPVAHGVILAPQNTTFTLKIHTLQGILPFSEVNRVHMWMDVADRLVEHEGLIHHLVGPEGIAAEVAITRPFQERDEQDVLKVHVSKNFYPKQFLPSPVMTYSRVEWRKGAEVWSLPIARRVRADTAYQNSWLRLVPGYGEIAPVLEWSCSARGRIELELESR